MGFFSEKARKCFQKLFKLILSGKKGFKPKCTKGGQYAPMQCDESGKIYTITFTITKRVIKDTLTSLLSHDFYLYFQLVSAGV